jgi:hypothetical protein
MLLGPTKRDILTEAIKRNASKNGKTLWKEVAQKGGTPSGGLKTVAKEILPVQDIEEEEKELQVEDVTTLEEEEQATTVQGQQRGRARLEGYIPVGVYDRKNTAERILRQQVLRNRSRFDRGTFVITKKFQVLGMLAGSLKDNIEVCKTKIRNELKDLCHRYGSDQGTPLELIRGGNGITVDWQHFEENFGGLVRQS